MCRRIGAGFLKENSLLHWRLEREIVSDVVQKRVKTRPLGCIRVLVHVCCVRTVMSTMCCIIDRILGARPLRVTGRGLIVRIHGCRIDGILLID